MHKTPKFPARSGLFGFWFVAWVVFISMTFFLAINYDGTTDTLATVSWFLPVATASGLVSGIYTAKAKTKITKVQAVWFSVYGSLALLVTCASVLIAWVAWFGDIDGIDLSTYAQLILAFAGASCVWFATIWVSSVLASWLAHFPIVKKISK